MHKHGGRFLAGGEQGLPVAVGVVDGRQPQVGGQLGERHRMGAAGGVAAHFGGGQVGVPQGDERQRDEPAAGAGAPLVDHPVVVGLHAQQGQLLVVGLHEGLAAEAGEHGKAHGSLDMVEVHVVETGLLLPAAGTHLLVVDGPGVDLLLGVARRRAQPGEGSLEVLVEPEIHHPLHIAVHPYRLVVDDDQVFPDGLAHHPGAHVQILAGQAVGPQRGRLHDVIVHRDDPRDLRHGLSVLCGGVATAC